MKEDRTVATAKRRLMKSEEPRDSTSKKLFWQEIMLLGRLSFSSEAPYFFVTLALWRISHQVPPFKRGARIASRRKEGKGLPEKRREKGKGRKRDSIELQKG